MHIRTFLTRAVTAVAMTLSFVAAAKVSDKTRWVDAKVRDRTILDTQSP